jgi:putative NADH-flavin reductase
MTNIVIFGGTGMIGQRAVREALSRGDKVTAVARDTSRITDQDPNLTVKAGDVTDPQSVVALAAGADVVISAVSPPRETWADGAQTQAHASEVLDGLLTGLRSLGADAPRLIVVGGAGNLLAAPGIRLIDTPDFPAEYKNEALAHATLLKGLRGVSDLEWVYFSPPVMIAPGERTGTFRLGGDELLTDAEGNSSISAEDYAVALIDEAENPKHVREHFTIAY